MANYNQLMKQHADTYYCRKNTDGVYVLVNHPAWHELRNIKHVGEKVHIEAYDLTARKLLLTMIDGTVGKFNSRAKQAHEAGAILKTSVADDGGTLVFNAGDLDVVATAFKIKKRRTITDEMRERGRQQYQQYLA